MSWYTDKSFTSGSSLVKTGGHTANILRQTLAGGKVKIYQDEKRAAERIEIEAPKGTVMILKDYARVASQARYKQIEVFSLTQELQGTIEIVSDMQYLHPTFRFFLGTSQIGRGSGDIGMYIAAKLLNEFIDPRLIAGASVDNEVIDTIHKLLEGKRV